MIVSAKKQIDPCPVGNHVARCIGVIDLGTQSKEYQGKKTTSRQVRITWELPEEKKVFREENGEQPYLLSKDYTQSLSQKARLKSDLESWRGRGFTDEELQGFDIKNLIGKSCLLNVIHNDKGYANIAAIAPVPKGTTVPAQINPSQYFDLNEYNQEVFESLPEFIQDKIKLSPEYNLLKNPGQHDVSGTDYENDDMVF